MINKESQKLNLVKGIISLGKDFSCSKDKGLRGNYVITCANTLSHSGAKRLWEFANEYSSFIIRNDYLLDDINYTEYKEVAVAYRYNHKTKRYVLNKYFFNYLKNVYLGGKDGRTL